ncbi:hypothetical protein PAPHI01_2002 [Pancytospora philotis]|nr:hypothetical protein PAPHI01_2002 [Pancytospora philotis]
MNFCRELLALFIFCLMLFNMGSSAVIPAERDESTSFLTRHRREQAWERVVEDLEMADADLEDRFDKFLFQCYYRDQPVRPKSERSGVLRPRLHGACEEDAFAHDIIPKQGRQHHHHGRQPRHADREARDEEVETTTPEGFEPTHDEVRDGLYTLFKNVKYASSRAYPKSFPADTELALPTFSADELEERVKMKVGIIPAIYGELVERVDLYNTKSVWAVSPFGRFYLKSNSFRNFLLRWERNDDNARYYISRDDMARIQDEAETGTSFHELSSASQQRFAKLVFVRNTLETYVMMRDVMEPLGLVSSERRTAEDFLQAMYGYLTAVHRSNGTLAVEYAVGVNVFASEILSFAYAGCHTFDVVTTYNGTEVALDDYIDRYTHRYVESMIVLFNAWIKSVKNYLDPAVLSNEVDEFYSFVKRNENYDDGCQGRARN